MRAVVLTPNTTGSRSGRQQQQRSAVTGSRSGSHPQPDAQLIGAKVGELGLSGVEAAAWRRVCLCAGPRVTSPHSWRAPDPRRQTSHQR
ncbi:hypothetical protein scyTo_0013407 [Scyliorhinus torazame]|uniref:Uncharacterized protein n=1 Tax=Scyliorhinus torazame TaxID=75743 RepID=A0A401NVQ3_SCYTO|nr:hypothetical protein [Scyliorhinus torazame]